MSATDLFDDRTVGLTSPGERHYLVVPSTSPLDPKPRSIRINTTGTLEVEDDAGVTIPYNVSAGEVLTFRPHKITGGNATAIAWY